MDSKNSKNINYGLENPRKTGNLSYLDRWLEHYNLEHSVNERYLQYRNLCFFIQPRKWIFYPKIIRGIAPFTPLCHKARRESYFTFSFVVVAVSRLSNFLLLLLPLLHSRAPYLIYHPINVHHGNLLHGMETTTLRYNRLPSLYNDQNEDHC